MIMGAWGIGKKRGYTAKDYVQNGLIAMWDAIENTGWGTHDAEATAWVDLVRPNCAIKFNLLSGDTWGSDNLTTSQAHNLGGVYGGGWYFDGTGVSNTIDGKTIELVFRLESVSRTPGQAFQWATLSGGPFAMSTAWGYFRFTGGSNGNYGNDNNSFNMVPYVGSSFDGAFSLPISGAALYNNGSLARSNFSYIGGADARYSMCFGVMGQSSVKWKSIRMYDKTLSAAEIAANYAVDAERFNLNGGGGINA